MNVIPGSPLDLLSQQFDQHVADQWAVVLHEGDEIRVVAACASIAATSGRFLIQRKDEEVDGWRAETWCDSPVAAAMWVLI